MIINLNVAKVNYTLREPPATINIVGARSMGLDKHRFQLVTLVVS